MSDLKVVTGECRMDYLNWAKPRLNEQSGKEQYSACLLVPKSDKDTVQYINQAVHAAVAAKWGSNPPSGLRHPLRDGDQERADKEAYQDMYFINVKSNFQPDTVGPDLQPLMNESDFRSGDFGRASLNAYGYDKNGNRGVAFGLNGLQKTRDGEPLGGGSRAKDDFEAVAGSNQGPATGAPAYSDNIFS